MSLTQLLPPPFAGLDSGIEAGPDDTSVVSALVGGCGVETRLTRPFHATGLTVYSNATTEPVLEDEHLRVFYKNESGGFEYIPVSEVSNMYERQISFSTYLFFRRAFYVWL